MDSKYPAWRIYERLYARYQRRPVGELIDVAGDVKNKLVLDLCGGTGRLAEECIRRGAREAFLVDGSSDMAIRIKDKRGVRLYIGDVTEFIRFGPSWYRDHEPGCPDVVFCRQAINYWFEAKVICDLARFLKPGAVFVFNTFNTAPPREPVVKTYEIDGHSFVEVFQLNGDVVHHVQCRSGVPMHTTRFRWIEPEEFQSVLERDFLVERRTEKSTDIYRCVRKG
jgi:SAM-dependent methyltransferase